MKKLFTLFVLVVFVGTASATMQYARWATGCDGTMGKIGINTTSSVTTQTTNPSYKSSTTCYYKAEALSGYTFNGWYTDAAATTLYSSEASCSYYKASGSITLYAKFSASGGGSGSGSGSRSSIAATTTSAKSVTVKMDGTGAGKTVNYALPDGVVDMGTAGYWATKNVGGTYETSAGNYFQWGGTTQSRSSSYTLPASADLVSTNDAATVNVGTGYCTPTQSEWNALMNSSNYDWVYDGTSYIEKYTVTSKATGNSINIPANTGYYNNASKGSSGVGCYWSSSYNSGNPYTFQCSSSNKTLYGLTSSLNAIGAGKVNYSMYIRPIYNMTGTLYTLTINVVNGGTTYTYKYKGASGQVVNVSVGSETGYTSQWNDNVSTASARKFTLTSNATYTVNFYQSNITISATSAGNGTGQVSTTNGSGYSSSVSVTPGTTVYLKATPSSADYVFDYWSNDQNNSTISTETASVNPTVATTYTAHFVEAEHSYDVTVAVASGCEEMGTVTGGGTELEANSTTTIRAIANLGYRFVRWNDDNTDAVREITVNADRTFTAYFEELPLKTTTVAQDGTGSGTYDMVKYSDDYVKLGNVYWATKNVGAESETDKGNYYAWGETTTKSDYQASTYTYTSQNVDENNLLPAAADAATSFAGLGSDWRMPTWSELRDLAFYSQPELTTKSGVNGYAFTRNGQSIFIPLTGYKWETSTYSTSSAIYLWGKQLSSVSYGGYYSPYYLVVYQNGNETFHDVETNARSIGAYEGMPIRPVYVGTVPTIPTCTLTINANNHTYTYIVVNGQQLTVTVNPLEHYRFTGWTKTSGTALSVSDNTFTITGDATYTANFEPITYTITVNSFEGNGKVVITSQGESQEIGKTGGSVTLGENVNVTIQAVPDARNRFISWTRDPVVDTDDVDGASIDIRTLQGNRTYTPTFESNVAMALVDTENEAYYSSLYNDAQYAGKVLTVTMTGRRLAEGSWMTFCAPFDFPIPAGHPMYGSVYRFVNGTMSGTNTEGYISLDFRRTYAIEANVPYLVVAGVTTDSDLEFDGVTIDAEPTQTPVEASSHHVQFVSQPWKSTLTNDALTMEDFYIASGNMLRYANPTTGTTIRAFRAYFHRLVDLGSAPRRMIISLDGVETTKEIGIDGEIEDTTRKYMENGILYIERNGVRYDAQGQRAE